MYVHTDVSIVLLGKCQFLLSGGNPCVAWVGLVLMISVSICSFTSCVYYGLVFVELLHVGMMVLDL